jgi:hypothetical protein
MKLPIKKKYFDQIKNGTKELEWRDAHITFICEETGETLRKEIGCCFVTKKARFEGWDIKGMTFREWKKMFKGENVICFQLE